MARVVGATGSRRRRGATATRPAQSGAAVAAPWYAVAIVVADVVYGTVSTPVGVAIDAVALAAMVVHYAALSPQRGLRAGLGPSAALPALATVALVRLAGFAAFVPGTARLVTYGLATAVVGLGLVLAAGAASYRPRWRPMRATERRLQVVVIASAAPVAVLVYLLGQPRPIGSSALTALVGAVVLVAAAIVEETLLRGLLLEALRSCLGPTVGAAYAALIGAGLYAGAATPFVAIVLGLFGAWLVLASTKGVGLRTCTGAHVVLSLTGFVILPLIFGS